MLSAGMHRTEHRNRTRGTFRFPAPRRPFSPPAGSILQSTPPAVSDQDRILVTTFNSPVTATPSRSFHRGVIAPGLLLRILPPVHTARSDLQLRCHPRFAPAGWQFLSFYPVAAPPCGLFGCFHDLASLRDFYLPRDHSSVASATARPAFRIRPISSRSP